jgi:hypothetical protein
LQSLKKESRPVRKDGTPVKLKKALQNYSFVQAFLKANQYAALVVLPLYGVPKRKVLKFSLQG